MAGKDNILPVIFILKIYLDTTISQCYTVYIAVRYIVVQKEVYNG